MDPKKKLILSQVKTTSCKYEYTINYKHIISLIDKETRVPYKIASFDIEASSSHGDFPLAKKNYKKLATNIVDAIKKVRSGQIEYKTDKAGIVHASIGKASFSDDDLIKNTNFFLNELKNKKPESSKGIFLKKIFINTTMGPGLQVDPSSAM